MSGDTLTGSIPDITVDEYKGRVAGLQALMDEARLDAVFVTSEANFRYVTGFDSPTWINLTRPRYCVVPLTGDPIIVSPTTNLIIIERTSWVTDVRSWVAPNPADDGISLLADALRSAAGTYDRIGAELGPESRMSMPVGDFLRVMEQVAPIEVVDGEGLFRRLRRVKSPAEVARMRRISQIVSQGFEDLPGLIAVGDTERAACRRLRARLLQLGAEASPYVTGQSGPEGYRCVNLAPSDRVLSAGDLFTIDTGSTLEGYYCDFNREWAIGEASDTVRLCHEIVWRTAEAGIAAAKPGVRCCDVWQAQADQLAQETGPDGRPVEPTRLWQVRADRLARETGPDGRPLEPPRRLGRMGHGVGLHMCEPPSIQPDDTTELVPGMCLTIEPRVAYTVAGADGPEPRLLFAEENGVVTEDGFELLTRRAPFELPVVS